jgi:hypothetical protein
MRLHLAGVAAAAAAVSLIACSDNNQQLPPGPRMQTTAPSSGGLTCSFKSLNQLATHYFGGPEAKVVRDILSAMQTAGAFTAEAQDSGFSVMSHIAANIKAGNTDVADASDLTNGLIACMYDSKADLPLTFPEDFSIPTNPALDGAYEVRGGAADPDTAVVFSRPLSAPFSGIAPPGPTHCVGCQDESTWPEMLSGRRALVYGFPGSRPQTYDWRIVPRSAAFTPAAVVGVCVNPFTDATSLVHEENVGLLPFVNALFMDLSTCSPVAAAPPSGPLQFARATLRWGADLFLPRPLSATSSVFVDGLGGTAGGVHSEFGPEVADTVILAFVVQPKDVRVNQTNDTVVVRATNKATGSTVANVTISLTAVNNNGQPAGLQGDTTQATDYSGLATFTEWSETKTGGYVLIATGSVGDRPAIVVQPATSARFNVRP